MKDRARCFTYKEWLIWGIVIVSMSGIIFMATHRDRSNYLINRLQKSTDSLNIILHQSIENCRCCIKTRDWELFVEALIFVESSGKHDAVGDNGEAIGVLQIHPQMVDDANRILQYEEFTIGDRYSPERSREIFDVIQRHYNPGKSIERAIHIWNPRAGVQYRDKIFIQMYGHI